MLPIRSAKHRQTSGKSSRCGRVAASLWEGDCPELNPGPTLSDISLLSTGYSEAVGVEWKTSLLTFYFQNYRISFQIHIYVVLLL